MTHAYGQHAAQEVIDQARSFLAHVEDPAIWKQMSEKTRGRMTHADVKTGRTKLAAASSAMSGKAAVAGGSKPATYTLDTAHAAASDWLTDQLAHARGALHEAGDQASLDALNQSLRHASGHGDVAANVRAYIELVEQDSAVGKAVAASYADPKSRAAILKDGAHLADALEAAIPAPAAQVGARVDATHGKDAAIEALARWGHRWLTVARRVLGAADLHTVGLASARHHPAHRAAHPAASPAGAAEPPPTS